MEKRRRRFTLEQKKAILKDHFTNSTPISVLARVNNLHPITLYSWKRAMSDQINEDEIDIKALLAEIERLKSENKKLLQAVGKAQLRSETAQEIIEDYKKKISLQQLKERKPLFKATRAKRAKK